MDAKSSTQILEDAERNLVDTREQLYYLSDRCESHVARINDALLWRAEMQNPTPEKKTVTVAKQSCCFTCCRAMAYGMLCFVAVLFFIATIPPA